MKIKIERLEINVYVGGDDDEVLEAVAATRESLMARIEDVNQLLVTMNDVTNAIAGNTQIVINNEAAQLAEIQRLRDLVEAGQPVTQEQLDALAGNVQGRVAALESIRDSLAAIATDPNNPAPNPPPIEEEPTEGEPEPEPGEGEPEEEPGGNGAPATETATRSTRNRS